MSNPGIMILPAVCIKISGIRDMLQTYKSVPIELRENKGMILCDITYSEL